LRRVLDAAGLQGRAIDSYERLRAGVSNRSYRVSANGDTFVVRLSEPGHEATLSLEDEGRLLEAVARAGLGPELVAASVDEGALITRYISAPSWTPESAGRAANIERAAALLQRLHRVAAAPPPYAPEAYVQRYCEQAAARGDLDAPTRRLSNELKARARDFPSAPGEAVLCHNDLVAANILDNGGLMLVDFEYAVLAQPIVDLASLAAMNDFDAHRREQLLHAYYGPGRAPYADSDFVDVVRLQRLLAYFWALGAPSGRTHEQRVPFAARPSNE
jgi:thiamine kinase-like enzyme